MIAFLAAITLAQSRVLEFVDPSANRISIQALLQIPKLGAKDEAKLDILSQAIPMQTLDYPRREMLMVTDGEPPRCDITPDYIRFIVNVSPEKLRAGLGVMESMVRAATLTQENLDAAAAELPKPDYWSAALDPLERPRVQLTSDEAQKLYQRVFRPERIVLIVGGKFNHGDAIQGWSARMDNWTVGREPKGYFDITEPVELTRNPGPVSTIDFVAAPVTPDDGFMPSRILSLFAIGVGKGSSLFRIVREKHAWSYRQDAILSPTRSGWLPRLLIASIPTDDVQDRVKTIKADLLDDIATWNSAIRDRALGMAEAVFRYQVGFNPLYVLGSSPVGNSLEDQTFLAGYWQLKTGKPWDARALLESMKQVSLDDLKQQASTIMTTAIPRILTGS